MHEYVVLTLFICMPIGGPKPAHALWKVTGTRPTSVVGQGPTACLVGFECTCKKQEAVVPETHSKSMFGDMAAHQIYLSVTYH
eukprot:COSAG01_NODE_34369_length_548_cov_43.216036_2_plen_82_part_01